MIVTVGYFFSAEGQREFRNAISVVCDNVKYTYKKFKEKLKRQFAAQLDWEAVVPSSIKLADAISLPSTTIAIGENEYKCNTKAESITISMGKNKDRYYPAVLSGGMVWVAPIDISRKVALAIMKQNDRYEGVFAVSSKYARGLCDGLGGAEGPENHGAGSGYWSHYHGKSYRDAHCWYIG